MTYNVTLYLADGTYIQETVNASDMKDALIEAESLPFYRDEPYEVVDFVVEPAEVL